MYALNFLDSKGNEVLHLVQWDLGRKLYLENTEELTNAPIFLFFNRKSETSIPVASSFTSNGLIEVEVPNDLLQYPYTVMVHMYEYEDSEHNCTVAKGVLPVTAKIKPSYYEYVNNIENIFDVLITARVDNRLNDFELTYLANLDDGSPKGTFTTVANLSNKDNGIYIYTGTTNTSASPQLKEGWIYYWDGESISDPIVLYQAFAIANGSVTDDMLASSKWNYVNLGEQSSLSVLDENTVPGTIYTVSCNNNDYIFFTLGTTQFKFSNNLGWETRRKTNDVWGNTWNTGVAESTITENMLSNALKLKALESSRKFESLTGENGLNAYMSSGNAEAGEIVRVKETVNEEQIYQVYILQNGENNTLTKKKINSNEEALIALENTVSTLSENNTTAHGNLLNRINNNSAGNLVYNSITKTLQLMSVGDGTENGSQTIGDAVIIDSGITGVQLAIEPDENDKSKNYLFLRDEGGNNLAFVLLPEMGSSSADYIVMRLKNLLPSTTFTVPYNEENGCECLLVYSFSSVDTGANNDPTGNGTAYYYVNNALVLTTQNLAQGNHTVDIGNYLTPNSTNNVRVMVIDSEGNRKSISYTITVAYNYLTSNFDALSVQTGAFSIPYTPNGSGDKIIYCVIDGDTTHKLSYQTTKSAQTFYFDITGLSHGGHLIEIYMSTLLDGQSERVTSNTLTFGVMMVSSNTPILYAKPSNTTIQQYSYNNLDFVTHSSNQENTVSAVVDKWVETQVPITTIEINSNDISCITVADVTTYEIAVVDNAETVSSGGTSYYKLSDTNVVVNGTKKYKATREYTTSLSANTDVVTSFPYRFINSGTFGVTLTFGEISQTVVYTVEEIDVAKAETNGLKYLFDPSNRSNKEDISTRNVHSYTNNDNETYVTTFNGIDFDIYGWTGTSLKIPHGGSVSIPFKPFLTDTDTTKGKTIEFNFKVKNVYDYSQNLISCIASDMGINILANKGNFVMGASSAVEVQYVENEEIRLSFVIAKRNSANDYRNQLVYVFVNSILSGVFQYGQADSFIQNPAAGITLGSNYAEIELYKIRCYDIELFNVQQGNTSRSYKILNNFIADSPDVNDMIERNTRNNIFDESNSIDSSLLPDDCPYMLIESAALPSARTDEFVISGYFVDKANPSKAFAFFNAKIKTQGTSSLDYFIKNFKITFKNGVLFEIGANIISIEINGEDVDCILSEDISTYGITLAENAELITVTDKGETKTYYKVSDTNVVTENGINYIRVGKYQLFSDSIPTNKFCLKADVASSEGANNTVLMKIWDDITRALYNYGRDTLTPAQIEDERVRQTIDSRPMVLYWRDTSNPNNPILKFWGKYNFNNDKGTHEVYGFNSTKYPDCQCWEFRDNGKALSQFKSTDFDTLVPYTNKKTQRNEDVPRWYETFEPRFPEIDDEQDAAYTQVDSTLLTKFKRVLSWVCSTDTTQANSSVVLANPVEYDGVTYTTDSAEYRLAKFKNEFTDYFKKDLTLLYYIFTDVFLLADNREKNQMITTFDGTHWFFIPYDGDTALGINNSGKYGFEYWLEGDSIFEGANVYNGRPSVLWNNVATVFASDIQSLCRALLSCDITNRDNETVSHFGFEYVKNRFNQYQSAWSEAIFCADAEHKYIIPYIDTADARYLSMTQGSKRLQREYWLKNRFIYWCSKYMIGNSTDVKNGINIRMTTPEGMSDERYVEVYNPCGNPSTSYYYEKTGNTYFASTDTSVNSEKTYYVKWNTLVVTSLTNTYILVGFGQNLIPYKCNANESIAAKGTLDSNGDSPLNFYNASEIKSVGDLSQSYISNFSIGSEVKNLESIVIGSEDNNYENVAITQLSTGSCEKLRTLNISNCKNLGTGSVKYIDISKCFNIREVLAKGTKINAVNLANGSQIRTLKLPNTIRNLELINQTQLSTFEMEGYDNLLTLKIQNTPVDVLNVLNNALNDARNLSSITLSDINWTFNQSQNAGGIALMDKLAAKSAIQGNTVSLTGTVHFYRITQRQYDTYTGIWSGLNITYDNFIEQYPVTFANFAAVASPTGNPSTSNYYELVNDEYVRSTDSSVDSEKTYYTGSFLGTLYVENGSTVAESWVITSDGYYVKDFRVVAEPTGNPSTSGYYELSNDTYVPSEDATVNSGKTYYELYDYLFDTPKRDYTWDKTYAFYGWDSSPGTRIRAPKTYNTVFTESDRQYTITFESDGNELYSTDVTAGGTLTYDTTYGTPSKEEITDTWYLCQGWIDTGETIIVDGVTDTSKIVGLYSTFTVNEALVGDFVADKKDVLKPNYVINSIFLECCLPDFMSDPEPADVTQYLSEFTYVYTNDPNYESAYTIGEIYAICKSDKFDLYLRKGDRARIICPEWNAFIGGTVADEQSGRSAFEIEVMGYNVYERADSGFTGIGDTWDGLACPYGVSGDYYNQTILGKFASFSSSLTDLSEKSAGLYVCDADGCVYHWNNDGNYPTKVTQYFSHVVWALRFADSSGNNGQTFGGYPMNSGNVTTNGWGDDTADSSKKCRANEYLNDGILSGSTRGRSLFSYFPSELQGVITPVKVLSAKGRDSSGNFSNLPVSSISKLFLLSDAEVFGANSVPYRNELNKWCSLGVWSSNTLSSFKTYSRITGNNNRIKKPNYATGSASGWWLRSPYSATYFVFVHTNGNFATGFNASNSYGLAPAFCIG